MPGRKTYRARDRVVGVALVDVEDNAGGGGGVDAGNGDLLTVFSHIILMRVHIISSGLIK